MALNVGLHVSFDNRAIGDTVKGEVKALTVYMG
jgi:hypothetical protein